MPQEIAEPAAEGDAKLPTGGDTSRGDLDAKPTPTFDPNALLPAEILPQSLASLKGKPLKEVLDSHGSLRSELTSKSEELKQLKQQLEEAKKSPAEKTPQQMAAEAKAAMVSTDEYLHAQRMYIEQGEVPADFVEAVSERGVVVPQDAILDFFEFQKQRSEKFLGALQNHAGEQINVREVLRWMGSSDSPYGKEAVKTFNDLTADGNFSWFDTVSEKYAKAIEAGYRPSAPGRYMGGERVRAHPAAVTEPQGFKDAADFQQQLLAVENDPSLTKAQRQQKRNELIQRRAKQRGENLHLRT